MALKNLFDMVKADRYTADGREELIKAQEAETEDATRRTYQIGEISEATGLQKTSNGWVKPKNGKQPGAKQQEKKGAGIPQATTETFVGKTYKDFVESATPSGYKPTKNTDNPDGSSTIVFEKEGKQLKVDFDKSGKITKVTPGAKKQEAGTKHPPMVMPKGMSPAEFMKAWEDDAKKNGFKKGQGNEWREHLRKEEAESKPAAEGWEETRMASGKIYDLKSQGKRIIEQYDPETETKTFKLRDLNNSRTPDKEFKSLEEAKTAATKSAESKPDSRALLSHKDHVDLAKEVMANGENWTEEEIAKEWKLTKGDAAEVKKEVDHLTRTRNQDRQDREDQIRTNVNNTITDIMRKKKVDDYYSESSPEGSKALLRERYALNDEEADQVYENLKTAHNMGVAAQEAEEAARQRESNDSAPSLSEIVDRVYNIGEISEKTGLQKTANGWVKPKKGAAPAKKEIQKSLKKQKAAGDPDAANKAMETNEHVKNLEQDLKQAQRTKAGPDKEFNIKYKILETLAGGTDAAFESFKEAKKSTASREEALEQALNKYNYSTEKKDKAKQPAGTRHAEKRKTNRPKAIRWNRNNLNEMRGNEEYINAKAADNYYHQYGLDKIGEWKDRKGWTVKEYQNDDGETYRAKYDGEKYVGSEYDPTGVILSPENKDAAPRVLTGDCRIRIRKEKPALTGDTKIRVRK